MWSDLVVRDGQHPMQWIVEECPGVGLSNQCGNVRPGSSTDLAKRGLAVLRQSLLNRSYIAGHRSTATSIRIVSLGQYSIRRDSPHDRRVPGAGSVDGEVAPEFDGSGSLGLRSLPPVEYHSNWGVLFD